MLLTLRPLVCSVICSAEGTAEKSSFFGYQILSVMSWEGNKMVTSNHVTDPSGGTKVTLSKHWMENGIVVNQTVSETGGEYKIWFKKCV